jgi:hypothetical protein
MVNSLGAFPAAEALVVVMIRRASLAWHDMGGPSEIRIDGTFPWWPCPAPLPKLAAGFERRG